jgi:hypothetical protein
MDRSPTTEISPVYRPSTYLGCCLLRRYPPLHLSPTCHSHSSTALPILRGRPSSGRIPLRPEQRVRRRHSCPMDNSPLWLGPRSPAIDIWPHRPQSKRMGNRRNQYRRRSPYGCPIRAAHYRLASQSEPKAPFCDNSQTPRYDWRCHVTVGWFAYSFSPCFWGIFTGPSAPTIDIIDATPADGFVTWSIPSSSRLPLAPLHG